MRRLAGRFATRLEVNVGIHGLFVFSEGCFSRLTVGDAIFGAVFDTCDLNYDYISRWLHSGFHRLLPADVDLLAGVRRGGQGAGGEEVSLVVTPLGSSVAPSVINTQLLHNNEVIKYNIKLMCPTKV